MKKRYNFTKTKNKYTPGYITLAILYSISAVIFTGYGIANNIYYMISLFLMLILIENKTLHGLIIVLVSAVSTAYLPIGLVYGTLSRDLIAAYYFTNSTEAGEFLNVIPVSYYFLQLLFVLLSVLTVIFKKNNFIEIKAAYKFLIIAGLITVPAVIHQIKHADKELACFKTPTIRFICDLNRYQIETVKEIEFLKEVNDSPSDWKPTLVGKAPTNVVIIIGESARRKEMSAYGFADIDTTPHMKTSNGILFTNYTSAASTTVPSLRQSLFINTFDDDGRFKTWYNDSIVRLYNDAGYKTNWISNQAPAGDTNSVITIAAKQADYTYFIKANTLDSDPMDNVLLPEVFKAISTDKPTATFIHLRGSHSNACERVKDKYTTYYRSKPVSCYLQSLINTDELINDVIVKLKETNKDWKLIYFSDHGQKIIDKDTESERYTHGHGVMVGHDAPLFVTGSEYTTKEVITNQRTGLTMISLLASFGNISDPLLFKCEFFKPVNCIKEPMVLINGKLTKYNSLEHGD